MPCSQSSDPWRGGVAQLGERLLCKQEVIGSNPFTSTTGKAEPCQSVSFAADRCSGAAPGDAAGALRQACTT